MNKYLFVCFYFSEINQKLTGLHLTYNPSTFRAQGMTGVKAVQWRKSWSGHLFTVTQNITHTIVIQFYTGAGWCIMISSQTWEHGTFLDNTSGNQRTGQLSDWLLEARQTRGINNITWLQERFVLCCVDNLPKEQSIRPKSQNNAPLTYIAGWLNHPTFTMCIVIVDKHTAPCHFFSGS